MGASGPSGGLAKRSVSIAGHRTSISLEQPFWDEIGRLARAEGISVQALVTAVDRERGSGNLSSALRLHVLAALRAAAGLGDAPPSPS